MSELPFVAKLRAKTSEARKRIDAQLNRARMQAEAARQAEADAAKRLAAAKAKDARERRACRTALANLERRCVIAAWRGDTETVLTEGELEWQSNIKSSLGLKLRTAPALRGQDRVFADIASRSLKQLGIELGVGALSQVESSRFTKWRASGATRATFWPALDKTIQSLGVQEYELAQRLSLLKASLARSDEARRRVESLDPRELETVRRYLANRDAIGSEYHLAIARLGGPENVGVLRKTELMDELLMGIGVYVDDVRSFFELADQVSQVEKDGAADRRKKESMENGMRAECADLEASIGRALQRRISLTSAGEALTNALSALAQNKALSARTVADLDEIKREKDRVAAWDGEVPRNSAPARRFLAWLTGEGGRRARVNITRRLDEAAEAGKRHLAMRLTTCSDGVDVRDSGDSLRLRFPCDIATVLLTIDALELQTKWRELKSGDIQLTISW